MIELSNINFSYDSRGISGLHHISFKLPAGKVMALMGPSGSGKSSLLKLIKGDLVQHTGTFTPPDSVAFLDRHQKLDSNHSLLENLLAVKNDVEEARLWLAQFELTNEIHRKVETLSGGQYQRALLARSLMNTPEILLIDEFFEQLDPLLRKTLWAELKLIIQKKKISVLWAGHLLEEVFQFADLLGVMNYGSLLQVGNPVELYHYPRSIFVAEFTGIINLIPAKKIDEKNGVITFQTSIGTHSFQMIWNRPDAVLGFRPEDIVPSNEGTKAKLISSTFTGQLYKNLWKINDLNLTSTSLTPIEEEKTNFLNMNARPHLVF